MNDLKSMEIAELQESLHSIFDFPKKLQGIECHKSELDAERGLISHLMLAFNLIDRGTD